MTDYTAHCEWDDTGWWVVTVPELPGAVTQSRRLDQVPDDLAEVINLLTGQRPGQYRLSVAPLFPGSAGEAAARAIALRGDADLLTRQAQELAVAAARRLRAAGLTLRDIGTLVGLSYQRVQQILDDSPAPRRRARAVGPTRARRARDRSAG